MWVGEGEPSAVGCDVVGYSEGEASSPENPIKGILKNKGMKSPINSGALNYSDPIDTETEVPRDNYEDESRFSKLVDSKEIYAKKVKAGLVKKRGRNSSTESAQLTFDPKRQDRDDKKDPKGSSKKPPLTV